MAECQYCGESTSMPCLTFEDRNECQDVNVGFRPALRRQDLGKQSPTLAPEVAEAARNAQAEHSVTPIPDR